MFHDILTVRDCEPLQTEMVKTPQPPSPPPPGPPPPPPPPGG